jgi:hypothetical protein
MYDLQQKPHTRKNKIIKKLLKIQNISTIQLALLCSEMFNTYEEKYITLTHYSGWIVRVHNPSIHTMLEFLENYVECVSLDAPIVMRYGSNLSNIRVDDWVYAHGRSLDIHELFLNASEQVKKFYTIYETYEHQSYLERFFETLLQDYLQLTFTLGAIRYGQGKEKKKSYGGVTKSSR